MATAVETIKNFMNVLTNYEQDATQIGRVALDDAVRKTTLFADLEDAVDSLKNDLYDTSTSLDTATRLQKATGMVIGAEGDLNVDTGAVTGANAGGSTVKNAASIVPEVGDLSDAVLPTPGSTTPVTYTGDDGKTFTFYVKWPDSFTTYVNGVGATTDSERSARLHDTKYHVDLNTLDPNGFYNKQTTSKDASGNTVNSSTASPTYGQMKSAIETALKGLNKYWLSTAAKLDYDSLGIGLDGQTIEIAFLAGGSYDNAAAITFRNRTDSRPSDFMTIGIDLFYYGKLNPTDPNGNTNLNGGAPDDLYLDRVIAHEMVHAIMMATGTEKSNMPQFFTEGVADLVQGDDDDNSEQRNNMIGFLTNSDTLVQGLSFEEGTGGKYNYAAGDMLMRYIAKQNLDTTAIIGDPSQAQTFTYQSGTDEVISNYTSKDAIDYQTTIGDVTTSSTLDDLIIKEATNNGDENRLVLRDVRGELITLNTPNGRAYGYLSTTAGELDGSTFEGGNNQEIIFGADYKDNVIRAGNAGSFLWGGVRGNDELFGGAGVDTFIYYADGGKDTIHNAESQDNLLFKDVDLKLFSSVQFTDNGIYADFTNGSTLNIEGQMSTFRLVINDKITTYIADYQNKTFTQQS